MLPMRVALARGFRASVCRFEYRGGYCLATCRPAGLGALQLRGFAAQTASKTGPLISTKDVNIGKLAGALANRIRETGTCSIDCIGPLPIYSAVKAVNIASGYLEESLPGQRLCVHHEWVTQPSREAPSGRETKLLRFNVRPVTPPATKDEPELILVSAETNTGLAAGLISRVIEKSGVAALGGMGSHSITNAVKAVAIAQSYLEKREALGDKVIAAIVRTEKFKESDEDRTRIVLSCILIPDPTKEKAA
eukprot:TRINITY_DN3441_c0_g1_i1.p1 TRINITY_DN3441_c0_g1~~TRINITY_DN3441_c0_g1_i1.p1  ORF type:complete len:250 (-),score=27.41 TRINITY_DN3441_c0_g1_i1:136-885(-)